jgi:multimeric flavodoxin WrbA
MGKKCFIISTLPKIDDNSNKIINSLLSKINDTEVFDTNNYQIGNCVGCNNCWLKTPGVCSVKDDWEIMFKKFLKSDCVIFITEAHLGFVSYKMKNLVDRLIPLGLPYTKLHKGEMRHTSRYKKCWEIGLMYSGNGDKDFLNEWMERFTLNLFSKSLGAHSINESGGLYREIGNI